jgi:hypothetical protein
MPEFARSQLCLAYVLAALLTILGLPEAGAAASTNPLAIFCRAHANADFPTRVVKQSIRIKQTLAAVHATNWRCMDGKVYVCLRDASGSACLKMNPSRTPSDAIRETCVGNPGQPFVAIAVIGNSSSTWRCEDQKPVIIKTVSLDQRGFMKETWVPLFDHQGKLNVSAELQPDPR